VAETESVVLAHDAVTLWQQLDQLELISRRENGERVLVQQTLKTDGMYCFTSGENISFSSMF